MMLALLPYLRRVLGTRYVSSYLVCRGPHSPLIKPRSWRDFHRIPRQESGTRSLPHRANPPHYRTAQTTTTLGPQSSPFLHRPFRFLNEKVTPSGIIKSKASSGSISELMLRYPPPIPLLFLGRCHADRCISTRGGPHWLLVGNRSPHTGSLRAQGGAIQPAHRPRIHGRGLCADRASRGVELSPLGGGNGVCALAGEHLSSSRDSTKYGYEDVLPRKQICSCLQGPGTLASARGTKGGGGQRGDIDEEGYSVCHESLSRGSDPCQ